MRDVHHRRLSARFGDTSSELARLTPSQASRHFRNVNLVIITLFYCDSNAVLIQRIYKYALYRAGRKQKHVLDRGFRSGCGS